MKKVLIPDFYVTSIYLIDFSKLKDRGIKNLIIDIDNTLVAWGSRYTDERAKALLNKLRILGFKVCLLSNSSKKRIMRFIDSMDVDFFSIGIKPMKAMFCGALKKLNANASSTCVIGDQILTDILGGNRCNLYTMLVDPISDREFPLTKCIRFFENKIRKLLKYNEYLMKDL